MAVLAPGPRATRCVALLLAVAACSGKGTSAASSAVAEDALCCSGGTPQCTSYCHGEEPCNAGYCDTPASTPCPALPMPDPAPAGATPATRCSDAPQLPMPVYTASVVHFDVRHRSGPNLTIWTALTWPCEDSHRCRVPSSPIRALHWPTWCWHVVFVGGHVSSPGHAGGFEPRRLLRLPAGLQSQLGRCQPRHGRQGGAADSVSRGCQPAVCAAQSGTFRNFALSLNLWHTRV